MTFRRWLLGLAALLSLGSGALLPAGAEAAVNIQAGRFNCGAGDGTMRPVAIVRRVGAQSAERRISVRFRLQTDGVQTAVLTGGRRLPDDTVEVGAPTVPRDGQIEVAPIEGTEFGDGGAGGPPLNPDTHSYSIVLDVFDFDAGDKALYSFPCLGDRDEDGLSDAAENYGVVGPDEEFLDLPAMGANPNRKDIFVQMDAMPGLRLTNESLRAVQASFATAPVPNPDGMDGITLHVDNGPSSQMAPGRSWGSLSQSRTLAGSAANYTFDDLNLAKSANLSVTRRSAFHYATSVDRIDADGTSGIAYRPGSDLIVSLGPSCRANGVGPVCAAPFMYQAGTFMHELGHNLGLQHGGSDEVNRKPNYLSVMNYSFQLGGLLGPGNRITYSSQSLPPLDETALDETVGFGLPATDPLAGNVTLIACTRNTEPKYPLYLGGSQDLDCDGAADDGAVGERDLNGDDAIGLLTSPAPDWGRLNFKGGRLGVRPPSRRDEVVPSEPPISELVGAAEALVPPPGAETGDASDVKPSSAALAGTAERAGEPAQFAFEYGTTEDYGEGTEFEPLPSGTGDAPAGTRARGLQPETTYHYRLVVRTDTHTIRGEDKTFTTPAGDADPPLPDPPDPTFGDGGWTYIDATDDFALTSSGARLPDGRLLAVGTGRFGGSYRWTITRLRADGRNDESFGIDGHLVLDNGGTNAATDVVVLPDGRFVVVGDGVDRRGGLDTPAVVLQRFHSDGAPDDTFGTGGRVALTFGTGQNLASVGVERLADGRLLVAGHAQDNGFKLVAVRLEADGDRDDTYGDNGVATLPIGASGAVADVVAQPDGALVMAGDSPAPSNEPAFAVGRLTPGGTPDMGFGFEGLTLAPVGGTGQSVALTGDGHILVAGGGGDHPFQLVRYTDTGQLDDDFGTGGVAEATWTDNQPGAQQVVPLADGGAIVGGGSVPYGMALAHFDPDGNVDRGFGTDGRVDLTAGGSCDDGGCGGEYYIGAMRKLIGSPGSDGRVIAFGSMRFGGRGEVIHGTVARFGEPPEVVPPGEEPSNEPPVARLVASDDHPRRDQAITLSAAGSEDPEGRVLRFDYDLDGDGSFEVADGGTSQSVTYPAPGPQAPRVRVTDVAGATDIATAGIEVVNLAPNVDLSLVANNPIVDGRPVQLRATADDPDDPDAALRLVWDLDGDGEYEHDAGEFEPGAFAEEVATFDETGTRFVGVHAFDADGEMSGALLRLDVDVNTPPTVRLVPDDERARFGSDVSFTATGSDPDGGELRIAWDDGGGFGDDATVFLPAYHTVHFDAAGRPTVRVRVSDEHSSVVAEATIDVVGNAAPEAALNVNPAAPEVGDSIFLDASQSDDPDGVINNYRYDLDGDGSYETDAGNTSSRTVTATAAGERQFGVQVTDNDGATAVATRTVTVAGEGGNPTGNTPPVAVLQITPASPVVGLPITLIAASSFDAEGPITGYRYDLDGDGSYETDGGPTPSWSTTATSPGARTFGVQVRDEDGATDDAREFVTIGSGGAPTPSPSPSPTPTPPGGTSVLTVGKKTRLQGKRRRSVLLVSVKGPGGTGTIVLRRGKKVVARGKLTLPADGSVKVRLRYGRKPVRTIKRKRKLSTVATVALATSNGPVVTTAKVVVRPAKRKKR